MRITKDIPYSPNGMQLDLYAPDQDGFDTLIWFHGGGFEAGSRRDAEPLAESVTAQGFPTFCWMRRGAWRFCRSTARTAAAADGS